jgi:tetratricopeptide (TPR) repeat protein
MGQEQVKQLLQQGIAAARAGRPDIARQTLQQAVRLDPQNETAWLWLSSVAGDDHERLFCLKQLLTINPQNEFALKGLRALGVEPVQAIQQAATASVPILDDARYARISQAADDFLRRYSSEPPDQLNIQWVHKPKHRYGETGVARLRRVMFAAAALVVVIVVGSLVLLISQLNILGGTGTEVGAVFTRIPSVTPTLTLTPTPGGSTPTPFPATMSVPATRVPTGLRQGSAYGLASPTAIYPRVDTDVARAVEEAASYYSIGNYTEAIKILQAERENTKACYPSVVYYEALSQASLGQYRDASTLLDWARNYDAPRGYRSCQGEALILAGMAQVSYMLDSQSEDALTLSEQALEADPELVQASLIKAQAELARGQTAAARTTVAQALLKSPDDVNLMVLAAQIEMADHQPGAALDYIGKALYVEPALQPALYLQTQIYLLLAQQSQPGSEQQVEYYGLAVVSAQTLLLYYSGDPAGYLYLAKARIGEGNNEMAETALDRVVAVADTLPDSAGPVVQETFRVRGNLYYSQGRLEEAKADLEQFIARAGSNTSDVSVVATLVDIAFQTGDYLDAQTWLSQLVDLNDDPSYQLLRAKLLVEICTFYTQISCDYRGMQNLLSDQWIATLPDEAERADAYSYRAQAQYREVLRQGRALSPEERQLDLQLALNDVTQALTVRETAVDHYYRGLILEELGDLVRALDEYQWVTYWSAVYTYPFKDANFDKRMASVADKVQEMIEAAAASPTPTRTPTSQAAQRRTATPTPTRTPTKTTTPRPTATPTTVPPTATPVPIP